MRTKAARRVAKLSRRLSKIAAVEGCSRRYDKALSKWRRAQATVNREVSRG